MRIMAMLVLFSQLTVGFMALRCVHLKALRDRRTPSEHQLGALNACFVTAFSILLLAAAFDCFDGGRRFIVVRQVWEAGLILLAAAVGLSLKVLLGEPRIPQKKEPGNV